MKKVRTKYPALEGCNFKPDVCCQEMSFLDHRFLTWLLEQCELGTRTVEQITKGQARETSVDCGVTIWRQFFEGALGRYFRAYKFANPHWHYKADTIEDLCWSHLDRSHQRRFFAMRYLAWAHLTGATEPVDWALVALYSL